MKRAPQSRDTRLLALLAAGRYFVTENGSVFDRDRGEVRAATLDSDGHPVVNLDGRVVVRVSRLVALKFLGMPPAARYQVRHLNGDLSDNTPSNIQWASPVETSAHAHASGLVPHPKGRDLPTTKLTEDQVLEVRKLLAEGVSMREVARRMGVSKGAVDGIKYRKSWRHLWPG